MPKVSVVIPAYNATGFIARAYASLASQTLANFEAVFVDDCSSDDTYRVIKNLEKADSRIRALQTPHNGGPSLARNVGFAAASGEWIAILDADDMFLPERLQRLVEAADKHGLDIIADNLLLYDAGVDKIVRSGFRNDGRLRPFNFEDLFRNDFCYGWLKPMFRSAFLKKFKLSYWEELRYGEDFHFYAECFFNDAQGAIIPEPLYRYTLRWGELSRQASGLSRTRVDKKDIISSLSELERRYQARISPELRASLQKRVQLVLASIRGQELFIRGHELFSSDGKITGLAFLLSHPATWPFLLSALRRRVGA
jgi:succinoglycan biosynthesis protein ExoO